MTEGSTVDGIGAFGLSAPGPELLEALRARLGPGGWRAPDDAPGLLEEPRGRFQGRAALIARPADAESAAEILRLCAAARAPVVPYGGGTGLVGGQVAPEGCGPAPVVLSLERLNRIRVVDADDDVAIVEAGVPLSAVRAAADDAERLFPLNLASRDSAQIGGLLATNAGGVAVLRYGSMRDLCLGLEAALPSGRVWNGLKRLRKNNMGYDLRNLLIGSEGTLGVIT
ncbi:MAG: FAD-binding oxidoreductase, partial [Pseudomonadota bacterium]